MNKKRAHKLKPKATNGISRISPSASIDDRLTHASLLLEYVFKHGADFQRRVLNLTGEINEDMFNLVDRTLTEMEADSRAAITIKINSPGGFCYQAMAIVGRIRESKCQIITKGYGEIMSAATLILAAGRRRKISKFSSFMWHEMSYGVDFDRHSNHKDMVLQAEKEVKLWAQWMEEFTGKPAKFWLEAGTKKDSYFTAEQLLKLGVVDELF